MKKILFLFICGISPFIGLGQINQIDVQKYSIDIGVSDLNDIIHVVEKINFNMSQISAPIVFNLEQKNQNGKGMEVTQLMIEGKTYSYRQQNDSLYIYYTPEKNQLSITVEIQYQGIPSSGLIIGKNKFGDRVFFGDNWPNRAQRWITCNDHPTDKALVDFTVHAPSKYQVIANGKQIKETEEKGMTTHYYTSNVPLPSKVMVIGIAEMEIKNYKSEIPVSAWVYPKNKEDGFTDFSLAPDILLFYQNLFGAYEYEQMANVQSTTEFGGMENAGCIFYNETSITGTKSCENLIAHEMVHQWFGNSASEKNWCDLWLSEGFATYFTNYYILKTKGETSFKSALDKDRKAIIRFNKIYTHPVVDTSYASIMDLLNTNSYQRGGWILHMLSKKLGEEAFLKSIRAYYSKYRLSNASTQDFISVIQAENPKIEWDNFFNQWLYNPKIPLLGIQEKLNKNTVQITLTQEQGGVPFEFPLSLKVQFEDGTEILEHLEIISEVFKFEKTYDQKIKDILYDPNTELLFESVTR